jgi:hypothetical protein
VGHRNAGTVVGQICVVFGSGTGSISCSLVSRVVEFRRVCGDLLSKGRKWVVAWRTTGLDLVPRLGNSRGVGFLGVVTLTERLVTAWD